MFDAADKALDLLTEFKIEEAIIYVYTSSMGNWFYVLLGLALHLVVYIIFKDIGPPTIVALTVGLIFLGMLPGAAKGPAYLMLALGIGGVVWKWFSGQVLR